MKVEISRRGYFRHHPDVYLEGQKQFTTYLVKIVKIRTGYLHNTIKLLHWLQRNRSVPPSKYESL
jgi:hypothetical protein